MTYQGTVGMPATEDNPEGSPPRAREGTPAPPQAHGSLDMPATERSCQRVSPTADVPAIEDNPESPPPRAREGTPAPPQAHGSSDMPAAEHFSQRVSPTAHMPLVPQPSPTAPAAAAGTSLAETHPQTMYAAIPRPLAPVVSSAHSPVQGVAPLPTPPTFPIKGPPVRFLQSTPAVLERAVRLAQPVPSLMQSVASVSTPLTMVCTPEARQGRAIIAQQVEQSMLGHFAGMADATLTQWRSQLDSALAIATAAHTEAKESVKRVCLFKH